MTYLRFFSIFALAVSAFFAPLAGQATESKWSASPEGRARLISAVTATGVGDSAPMGVEIVLKEGWKTYWRAPGPQGYPPRLDWSGSENIADARIVWPTPKRFTILGFDSIGYAGGVLLPLQVRFKDPSQPARIRLAMDYLTCAEVCVPQLGEFALDLPAGVAEPTSHAFAIDRARGHAPAPPGADGRIDRVWIEGPVDAPALVVEASAKAGGDVDLFVDGFPGYFFAAPSMERLDDGRIRLRAAALEAPETPAEVRSTADIVLRLGDVAVEQQAALIAPPADAPRGLPATGAAASKAFPLMLAIAFLGGLILNVMPCVLPVLAIKLMGALGHVQSGRAAIRRGFLASAVGIVVSFLALAGGAIALKAGGMAVGWGMQFQQPLFVAFMALALAAFAANLWGAFAFAAPEAANRLASAGSDRPEGVAHAFWSGVLATALATPCSAPFVGAALTFALSQGPLEIGAIFLAMGLGLAAPYLLTAAFPAIAGLLPRPGKWMDLVRKLMGLAVAGAGVWLLWVLLRQAGLTAAVLAAVAAVLLVGALAYGRALRWGAAAAVVAGGLAAVALTAAAPGAGAGASEQAVAWARFDQAEIARRVAAGETVLVDVTADWCVTCKWNKATVLSQAPVAPALADKVFAMQADWTRPDPVIADYLAGFGRYGIPFNVVYGPAAPDGLPLPELLSADTVMAAIAEARGGAE